MAQEQTFPQMGVRDPVLAARQGEFSEPLERPRSRLPIADPALDGQRFLEARRGAGEVTALARERRQQVQRVGDARLIVKLTRKTQALLPALLGLGIVAAIQGEMSEP